MGRKEAARNLRLEDEQRKLDAMDIIHAVKSQRDLDEAPSAYKNIHEVMANQEDLVKIKVKLRPLTVVKD
jgi:tRNA-splicing ligase RtcB